MITPGTQVVSLLPPTTILLGLTGSKLYGLDTEDSDLDWKGIFQAPTEEVLGLDAPSTSTNHVDPDVQTYELGHYVNQALKCNPTLLELLWLPEYPVLEPAGELLVENRELFLWSKPIRNAFFGIAMQNLSAAKADEGEPSGLPKGGVASSYGEYADSQFGRLVNRGDGTYKSKIAKRTAKHTRHLFRLLDQGEQLLTTGTLNPRVSPEQRERLFALGELPVEEMVPIAEEAMARFKSLPSVLPAAPRRDEINSLLVKMRLDALSVPFNGFGVWI